MKKIFLVFGILSVFAVSAYAADKFYSSLFMIRFLHCLPTNMKFSAIIGESNVTHERHILNWHNNMCGYKVVETIDDETDTYTCDLTRDQVTEFAYAMRRDPDGVGDAKTYWENLKADENSCKEED